MAAAIALATGLSLHLLAPAPRRFTLFAAVRFLAFFLWQAVRSGGQITAMVLRPRLDLQPALVELEVPLPDEGACLFLATSLSLLPGTLTCGLEGTHRTLHVLDARRPTEPAVRAAQARVGELFGGAA